MTEVSLRSSWEFYSSGAIQLAPFLCLYFREVSRPHLSNTLAIGVDQASIPYQAVSRHTVVGLIIKYGFNDPTYALLGNGLSASFFEKTGAKMP